MPKYLLYIVIKLKNPLTLVNKITLKEEMYTGFEFNFFSQDDNIQKTIRQIKISNMW